MSILEASNVVGFFGRVGLFRGGLLAVATFLSVFTYYIVVSTIDSDSNVLKYIASYDKEFQFFTGDTGGFYVSIGEGVRQGADRGDLKVIPQRSAGGDANAINVLTTPQSFGLVQEETISKDDFIREHIQYVTPLYLERMHILYRKAKVGKRQVTLDSTLDRTAIELFSDANVNLGPVGSGTRVLASYVVNEIESKIASSRAGQASGISTFNFRSSDAIDRMEREDNERIDVVFLVSGAPNLNFYERLSGQPDEFGLVSISPAFIASINKSYDLNLRISDFRINPNRNGGSRIKKLLYPNAENISTIGTYAFLVASKDVSEFDQRDFVENLWVNRSNIEKEAGLNNTDDFPQFPLEELQFFDNYEEKFRDYQWEFVKELAVFFTSVFFGALLLFRVLNRLLSVWVQRKYVSRLTGVQVALRSNYEEDKSVTTVEFLKKQINILFQAEDEIYRDFNHGELIAESHAMLIESLDRLKRRARQQLYQHAAKSLGGVGADVDEILGWMRSGYLSKEQAEDLMR